MRRFFAMLLFAAGAVTAAATQPKSGLITTSDGVEIHYLEAGSGDPMVFMPGWSMVAGIFQPQLDAPSSKYRGLAVDPRSQGDSHKSADGNYPERRARDYKELMDTLKLQRPVLVGWSLAVGEVLCLVDQFGAELYAESCWWMDSSPIHFNIPPALFFGLFIGIAALFVLMFYAVAKARQRRAEELGRLTLELGVDLLARSASSIATELAQIRIPQLRLRKLPSVLRRGSGSSECVIADVTISSGRQRFTQTIIPYKFPEAFPNPVVAPENFTLKLVAKLGCRNSNFPDSPECSSRFFLHGDDEAAIRSWSRSEIGI